MAHRSRNPSLENFSIFYYIFLDKQMVCCDVLKVFKLLFYLLCFNLQLLNSNYWLLCRICEFIPEAVLQERFFMPLLTSMVECLGSEPRVASNICWVRFYYLFFLLKTIRLKVKDSFAFSASGIFKNNFLACVIVYCISKLLWLLHVLHSVFFKSWVY